MYFSNERAKALVMAIRSARIAMYDNANEDEDYQEILSRIDKTLGELQTDLERFTKRLDDSGQYVSPYETNGDTI